MRDEIINKLIEYIEGTKDFILDQAPCIVQEILAYDTKSTVLWLCFACILAACGIGVCLYGIFSKKSTYDKPLAMFAYFVTPMVFVAIFACCDNLIKIKVAPKYYVLEKIIKMKGK